MKEWRQIKSALESAMDHVNCCVYYHKKTSTDSSYFTIKVYDEEYEPDNFYSDLEEVADEWNLTGDDWFSFDGGWGVDYWEK